MTQQPRTPTQITDPSGQTVAANVRRFREVRGWSTYELSRKLKQAGRPISASALAKVERSERRVDVGDLMALAAVLRVNPTALLLPRDVVGRGAGDVEITGAGTVPGWLAWGWADGVCPLVDPDDDRDGSQWLDFAVTVRPSGWSAERNVGLRRGRAQLRKAFGDHYGAIEAIEEEDADSGESLD